MSLKTEKILKVLGISVIAVLLIASLVVYIVMNRTPKGFVPPKPDTNCVTADFGALESSNDISKIEITKNLSVYFSPIVSGNKKQINLEFASAETNTGNIKLELLDDNGNVVAASGLIHPGEYLTVINHINKKLLPKENATLTVKVLTYEPETYISMGTCNFVVNFEVSK